MDVYSTIKAMALALNDEHMDDSNFAVALRYLQVNVYNSDACSAYAPFRKLGMLVIALRTVMTETPVPDRHGSIDGICKPILYMGRSIDDAPSFEDVSRMTRQERLLLQNTDTSFFDPSRPELGSLISVRTSANHPILRIDPHLVEEAAKGVEGGLFNTYTFDNDLVLPEPIRQKFKELGMTQLINEMRFMLKADLVKDDPNVRPYLIHWGIFRRRSIEKYGWHNDNMARIGLLYVPPSEGVTYAPLQTIFSVRGNDETLQTLVRDEDYNRARKRTVDLDVFVDWGDMVSFDDRKLWHSRPPIEGRDDLGYFIFVALDRNRFDVNFPR